MKSIRGKTETASRILSKTARVYAVTIVLLILISKEVVYRSVYADMEKMAKETISLKLDSTARLLNNMLDDANRCFQAAVGTNGIMLKTAEASNTPLYHFISEYRDISFGDRRGVKAVRELKSLNETLKQIFRDGLGTENSDYRIRIYLDNRFAVTGYMSEGKDVNGDGIYKAAMTKENPVYSVLHKAGGERICFRTRRKTNDGNYEDVLYMGQLLICNVAEHQWQVNKQCLGYVVCEFSSDMIKELLGGTEYGSMSAYVLDKKGELWASYESGHKVESGELKKIIGEDEYNGSKDGLFVKKSNLSGNILLVIVMPQEVIREPVIKNVLTLLSVLILLLTAFIGVLFYFNWHLIRPVVRLTKHMEKGELLKIEADRSVNSTRETQILYRRFNSFIEQSKSYIDSIYSVEAEKRRMEYRMLQAQINPHFLYNTLDSISCLAMLNGQIRIADLLKSLAQIMRYSIHNPQEPATLREEIAIVKEYEKIQQNCSVNHLGFFYELEEAVAELTVPKLLIQPLVENAIFHGMNKDNRNGIVEISAVKKNGFVLITVWDNGTGLDTKEVQRYLNGERSSDENGGGLGIYNIRMRLKSRYGEEAELTLQKDENGCTEAIVRIPL